ncbi:ORF130 [Ranid herpesvirus 2]|uniref:ORF130 n=1 Tax=Ranid herpesvirus 2 TaxID=389214 RepID=Q14VX6_9VIRU|nr:ORF130 [Ranid herpesvirus 2]ABG25706.1 ORF130 [Ranid herpesvirus 2]
MEWQYAPIDSLLLNPYDPTPCIAYSNGLKTLRELKLDMPPAPHPHENLSVYVLRRAVWTKDKLGALRHHSLHSLENHSALKFSLLTILCEGQVPAGHFSHLASFNLLRSLLHPCSAVRVGHLDLSLCYVAP